MNSLEKYFEAYAACYLTFDCDALLNFFHYPCIIHDMGGVHLIDSEEALRLYERPMLEQLRSHDATFVKSEVKHMKIAAHPLSSLSCTVGYILRNSDGKILLDFDYDYVLVGEEGAWQILFAQIGLLRSISI